MEHDSQQLKAVYLFVKRHPRAEEIELREPMHFTKFVEQNLVELQKLVQGIKQIKLVEMIRSLASQHAFASDDFAKSLWPELFDVRPGPTRRSVAQPLLLELPEPRPARKREPDARPFVPRLSDQMPARKRLRALSEGEVEDIDRVGLEDTIDKPSSPRLRQFSDHPRTYLALSAQNAMLSTVQKILEDCCYEVCREWLPELIEEYRWDSPRCVELNVWRAKLVFHFNQLPRHPQSPASGTGLRAMFERVMPIRNAAVHRDDTDAGTLDLWLQHAINLTYALDDAPRAQQLLVICEKLHKAVHHLNDEKDRFRTNLDTVSREIDQQMERLIQSYHHARRHAETRKQEATAQISASMVADIDAAIRGPSSTAAADSQALVLYRPTLGSRPVPGQGTVRGRVSSPSSSIGLDY